MSSKNHVATAPLIIQPISIIRIALIMPPCEVASFLLHLQKQCRTYNYRKEINLMLENIKIIVESGDTF